MNLFDRARRGLAARIGGAVPAPVPVEIPTSPVRVETPVEAAARVIGAASARFALDVGAHHGDSTLDVLAAFPAAMVHAFEPDADNHAAAVVKLAGHAGRAVLHRAALSDRDGTATLRVNSHDGTHSLLDIGAQRYWGAWAGPVGEAEVPTTTLDSFCAAVGIERIEVMSQAVV